jgi:tetratricopeptide (TPR) repeat protein
VAEFFSSRQDFRSENTRQISQGRRFSAVLPLIKTPAGTTLYYRGMTAKIAIVPWVWANLVFFSSAACFSQSGANSQQQVEAHSHQAQEFLKQNRPDLAIPEFRAIVALDPNNVDARGNLGVLLFFQGDYAAAIPQLRAALRLRPTLWKMQALLGMAERRTGSSQSALADLEKAFPRLQEEKIQIEAGMELIEIHTAAGDLDKAAATVGALRSLYPTNVEVLYAAYRIYSDLTGEAMLSLSLVAPTSARMHQVMAHELEKHGDDEAAIRNYREALKLDPMLPGLHFELAEVLNASSAATEQQEAEGEYKAALSVNQLDERAEFRLGDIASRRGDVQEAYAHYSRAVQLQPNDAEANIGLAKVLMLMNQPDKAEPLLERALQLDPTSAAAHFRLSTLYRQAGRTADAKRELEEYQKYKEMKEKLQNIYHDMRVKPAKQEGEETDVRQ